MRLSTIKRLVKSKPYFSVAIVIVILLGAYFSFKGNSKNEPNTLRAVRGDVIQQVSVTGKVESSEMVDLSFEKPGKISKIYAKIGDKVTTGTTLLSLENSDVTASLNQAKAQLEIDKVKLAELLKGTRKEDLQIKEAELDKAKQDLENYYNDVRNTSEDAYITADDAVRVKTSGIFSADKITTYQFTYVTCVYNEESSQARQLRFKSEDVLGSWKKELDALTPETTKADLENLLNHDKSNLDVVRALLQKINETLVTGCTINDSSLNSYRTNISTARANVINAIEDIVSLQQSIQSQKLTVQKVERELELKLAGNTEEQISAQKGQVDFSKARVEGAEAELQKTIITAPFNGTITREDAKLGATVSVNSPIASMISESKFEIKANVPEVDIAKIKIGNVAQITLDAYGSDVIFNAKVIRIDPAETILDGVPTYKTTLQFVNEDEKIKSGMTANVEILIAKSENVLTVPERAVFSKDGSDYVKLSVNGITKEVPVKIGLKGHDGSAEVTDGLKEGDTIVISL